RGERAGSRQLARVRPIHVHGEVHLAQEIDVGERLADAGLGLEVALEAVDGAHDRRLLERALAVALDQHDERVGARELGVDGGVGSMARTAGMMVSSMTSAERMPKPVNSPKVRMVAVRKVTSEQNDSAAIEPAAIMTGPTRASDSMIAASTSFVRSNSS